MCQEKEEEEDLPALRIALTHRYNDSKITEKHGERLIIATRNNTDNTRINRTKITIKQKLEGKQLYRRFKGLRSDISHEENVDMAKKKKP